jgi:DNA-directed RNA polymerase specialized sigma24 family protein
LNIEANNVTQLLTKWRDGDEDAPSQLAPLVCEELRRLTRDYFQRDLIDPISPDASPVREAYLRMVDDGQATEQDRARFYRIAAHEMRRVLMEHAQEGFKDGNDGTDLVVFDGVLKDFAQTYPRKSEVVELKFFGGLEMKEISELLQISEKTVLRDWNFAKLWLCRALNNAV